MKSLYADELFIIISISESFKQGISTYHDVFATKNEKNVLNLVRKMFSKPIEANVLMLISKGILKPFQTLL